MSNTAMHDEGERCPWCKTPLPVRRFGQRRRFCSKACGNAFWSAARRSTARRIEEGRLGFDDVRREGEAPPLHRDKPARKLKPRRARRIEIETAFWPVLEEIAKARRMSLRTLTDEVVRQGSHGLSVASRLRLYVLTWQQERVEAARQASPGAEERVGPADRSCCPCCSGPLPNGKRGGSERRFCSPACRMRWWSAARAFIDDEVKARRITPEQVMASRRAQIAAGEREPEAAFPVLGGEKRLQQHARRLPSDRGVDGDDT